MSKTSFILEHPALTHMAVSELAKEQGLKISADYVRSVRSIAARKGKKAKARAAVAAPVAKTMSGAKQLKALTALNKLFAAIREVEKAIA